MSVLYIGLWDEKELLTSAEPARSGLGDRSELGDRRQSIRNDDIRMRDLISTEQTFFMNRCWLATLDIHRPEF